MAWWNPFSWGRSSGAALATGPLDASVDFSEFMRTSWMSSSLSANDIISLGSIAMGCTPSTPPTQLHAAVLDAMGLHPAVYLSEAMVTAPASDPDLYFLRGDDRLCAETEAWLRPLLSGQRAPLLSQIARAFGMGCVPFVLDFEPRDLTVKVPRKKGEGERNANLLGHVHYVRSHELWPGETQLRVKNDRLTGVIVGGVEHGGEDLDELGLRRAYAAVWDPKPGQDQAELWQGQGSRRRAYKDWIEEGAARLWEIRAIERGVDLPRVGYAPPEGELKIDGRPVSPIKLLRAQIMSLRNGSALVLPNTLLKDGSPAFKVDVLKSTVQSAILEYAIDSRGKRMMAAALVPGGSLEKATEEQLMDAVQRACDFVARTLTRVVNTVVQLNWTGRGRAPFVQVVANDIPKRKLRTALDVFKAVVSEVQHLPDGKVVTIGELVDGPEILKQLGIMDRPLEEAAHDQPAPPPPAPVGRPVEAAGEREERRDAARTVEGESDTGGQDQEREERA